MGKEDSSEEPFLLSILPFAGLALLLGLALVWKYLPSLPGKGDEATPAEDRAKAVIEAWEGFGRADIPISDSDFTLGPADAPVTLVEFSDFQCPYCRTGAAAVKAIVAEYPRDVRLVFKNFPLDTACNEDMQQQLHPLACRAAIVARCAGEADRDLFWRVHDAIFAAPAVTEELLSRIPQDYSVPAEAFERCVASETSVARIQEDLELGRKLGVTGTPAYFVNGRRALDYRDSALMKLVEHVLAGAGES